MRCWPARHVLQAGTCDRRCSWSARRRCYCCLSAFTMPGTPLRITCLSRDEKNRSPVQAVQERKRIELGKPNMEIKRVGTQASMKGPADWFTGTVRIDPLFQANAPARAAGAMVTF